MVELKPCPFCGGKAKLRCHEFLSVYAFYIECDDCGSSSNHYDHINEAQKAWNRRADNESI